MPLSSEQRSLLEWLSQEDSSSYGECHGKDLDALVEMGLASVSKAPEGRSIMFCRVCLTEAGLTALDERGNAPAP